MKSTHQSTSDILSTIALFLACLLLSAPAWYLVKYQVFDLGVDSEYAVGMRMLIGGSFLALFRKYFAPSEVSTADTKKPWLMIFAQGMSLYAMNFWFAYEAAHYIVSGLIAVAFCAMILPNHLLGKIFLKTPITFNNILGAILGLAGIALCFLNDLEKISFSDDVFLYGSVLAFIGVFFSVVGTQLTGKLVERGLSSLYISSRGMIIAGVASVVYSFLSGKNLPNVFSSIEFWASLLYLALLVTTVSNVLYVRLVKNFGAGNASFLWLCLPVFCLGFSTIFESYEWTLATTLGINLILLGGVLLNSKVWLWLISVVGREENA